MNKKVNGSIFTIDHELLKVVHKLVALVLTAVESVEKIEYVAIRR